MPYQQNPEPGDTAQLSELGKSCQVLIGGKLMLSNVLME